MPASGDNVRSRAVADKFPAGCAIKQSFACDGIQQRRLLNTDHADFSGVDACDRKIFACYTKNFCDDAKCLR
jgi:hypothetical protein